MKIFQSDGFHIEILLRHKNVYLCELLVQSYNILIPFSYF